MSSCWLAARLISSSIWARHGTGPLALYPIRCALYSRVYKIATIGTDKPDHTERLAEKLGFIDTVRRAKPIGFSSRASSNRPVIAVTDRFFAVLWTLLCSGPVAGKKKTESWQGMKLSGLSQTATAPLPPSHEGRKGGTGAQGRVMKEL
jgi:hypothetical protein